MASTEASGGASLGLATRAYALVFVAHFMHAMSLHSYIQISGWLEGFGLSEVRIGWLIGVSAAMAVAIRPTLGRWMDRKGRKVVILAGGVASVIASTAYLTVSTVGPTLWCIRIIHGFAQAALFSSMFTLAADVTPPERRAQGIAIFGIGGLIPMSLANLAGDYLTRDGDYTAFFASTAVYALLGLLLTLPLAESLPARDEHTEAPSFVEVMSTRSLAALWILGGGYALALSPCFAFLKLHVTELGVGSAGRFFSGFAGAAVVLRLGFGRVPDRFGFRRALIPAMCSTALGLMTLWAATSDTHILVAGLLCGVGHGFTFPVLSAMIVDRCDVRGRGTAISSFTALFDLGMLAGAPAFGALATELSYGGAFAVSAGMLVVVIMAGGAADVRLTRGGAQVFKA
ncbi:MAG: MFS transporter [Nannocystaceae bacterium]